MKKWLIGCCWMLLSLQWLTAQTDTVRAPIDSTTFVYGNVMYDKGNYAQAAGIYEQLLQTKGPSAEVYFNLGNCYYKLNQIGKTVLSYERALALDPGNEDIRYNLDLANLRIRDKMDTVNESVFAVAWHGFLHLFALHTWTVLAIIFLWIALGGFVVYRLTRDRLFQRYGFYVAAITFFLFLVTVTGAFGRNSFNRHHVYGVIMAPSAIVKSEPGETSTNLFLIHEGLKIQLLRNNDGWTEIKMPDGNIGWVQDTGLEKV